MPGTEPANLNKVPQAPSEQTPTPTFLLTTPHRWSPSKEETICKVCEKQILRRLKFRRGETLQSRLVGPRLPTLNLCQSWTCASGLAD